MNDDALGGIPHKKKRKSVNLKVKLEILQRSEAGQRGVDIAKTYGLPATTVRSIVAKSEKIKKFAKSATSLSATKLTRHRSNLMSTMESLLTCWLEDQNRKGLPVSRNQIQEKARNLYEDLKVEQEIGADVEPFIASRGWLDRFKKRARIYNNRNEEDEIPDEIEMPPSPLVELTEYRASDSSTSDAGRIEPEIKRRKFSNEPNELQDEFDAIAISIAAKLRKMNERDENQRYYCEKVIYDALFKALMNKLTENTVLLTGNEPDFKLKSHSH